MIVYGCTPINFPPNRRTKIKNNKRNNLIRWLK